VKAEGFLHHARWRLYFRPHYAARLAAHEISDFTVRHLEVGTGAGVTRASDRMDVFTGLSKRF
jgi:hypothetical protein